MKLCLEWNQIETARNYLFNNQTLDKNSFYDLFKLALEKNNVEFVKLILEIRINTDKFLTQNRLDSLYRIEKVIILNRKIYNFIVDLLKLMILFLK